MEYHNNNLIKKYFVKWKTYVETEKTTNERQKVKNFIKELQKRRNKLRTTVSKPPKPKYVNFKNRFEAQKVVIDKLNTKLEEKDKLIDELKLGIIREDILKSIDGNKTDIREIFNDCSVKVRCKVPLPVAYVEKFMIKTQKAPKIVQRIEQRALERAEKRELILERKRLIEEQRKQMLEEALEKKRVQDEEEKRRNLEQIKERRKKELELAKIREKNKQIFLDKLEKAIEFHNHKLLLIGFNLFKSNCEENKANYMRSVLHYRKKIFEHVLKNWNDFIEEKYYLKNQIADANYAYKTLKKYFRIWFILRIESIRSMQTAEDLYDFRLLSNSFIAWHRYVCIQIVARMKLMEKAQHHYNRRIIFQYFHQWRSLPAVLQLEKIKEERKRKWREKVWAILPDYQPPQD